MNNNLVENLRLFREKYESVLAVNKNYEKMFQQMKEYCKKLHAKFNDAVRNIWNAKAYLENNIKNLEAENAALKEQISKLVIEKGTCDEKNAVLQNTIQRNEATICEMQKQLEQLNSKLLDLNLEHEHTIAQLKNRHEEEIQKILKQHELEEESRKRKLLETASNNNQVQSKVVLEKEEYLNRLKYLEQLHREDCDKKDAEILRLQGLLKVKNKTPVKTKTPVKSANVPSRYPALGEFIQIGNPKSEPIGKRRKLFNPAEDIPAFDLES